jgi:hypothetical protein
VQQVKPDVFVEAGKVLLGGKVRLAGFIFPGDIAFGGEDPVGRLFQGRILIPDIIFEAGICRLQDQEVFDTGGDADAVSVLDYANGMLLRAAVEEGMRMGFTIEDHPAPAKFRQFGLYFCNLRVL